LEEALSFAGDIQRWDPMFENMYFEGYQGSINNYSLVLRETVKSGRSTIVQLELYSPIKEGNLGRDRRDLECAKLATFEGRIYDPVKKNDKEIKILWEIVKSIVAEQEEKESKLSSEEKFRSILRSLK
jgi:hypothetical protein